MPCSKIAKLNIVMSVLLQLVYRFKRIIIPASIFFVNFDKMIVKFLQKYNRGPKTFKAIS